MTEAAVGLAEGGAINGELGGWSEPGAFAVRIKDLRTWIDDNADRVVLFLDAPRSWGGENAEDTFFSTRTRETALTLALSSCRRVVAGRFNIVTPPIEKVTLDSPPSESAWLEDLGRMGNTRAQCRGAS